MEVASFQFEFYRIAAPCFAVALAVLLAVSRSRALRKNPASNPFSLFVLATIGFLIANTLEISARTEADNLFWSRAIYLFIPFIPLLWLSFTYSVSGEGRAFPRRAFGLLLIVPLVTLGMVFSDSWMGYIWPSISYLEQGGYVVSIRSHGPWFAVYVIHTYLVAAAGLVIAVRSFVLKRSYFRKRSALLLAGVALPILASGVYILRPFPWLVKDYTPISYAVSAFFFFFVIYRMDAFSVIPVAREHLVERMPDGMLMIDAEARIADANRAALEMLGADESIIGKSLPENGEVSDFLPREIVDAVREGGCALYRSSRSDGERRYSVESIDLPGRLRSRGRLILIRDETELRKALERLESLARTDVLTGLANRRGFFDQAGPLVASAQRYGEPVAVAMFDLDRFKSINDTWGHAAGDEVLRAFSDILRRNLRGADSAGRIGGEEFALVLPRTDLSGARVVCERIRAEIAARVFSDGHGAVFSATVSVGLASSGDTRYHCETLLADADTALYKAKAAGRNRTAAFGDPE